MCGIVALRAKDKPIQPLRLARALDSLAHRGPDGANCWMSADAHVALGHRRLSIIDLTTGAQPLSNEDDSIQIVVNGEFYEYEKIRGELTARGHLLRTQSDSEIAVHLYEDFGLEMLKYLRGEFAFVLWDSRQQRLYAARDRFGIKPLFYAKFQNTLYIASEAKALFGAGVPATWDLEAVYRQLFLCYAPDHSMFERVRQIPPGHVLIEQDATTRLLKYWDFGYPRANEKPALPSPQELVLQNRELLSEAIRLRLRADVPVGVMLSGGLDSSSLLGFASALSSKPPTAFSIAFPHAAYDESATARRTAEYFQTDFHQILVTEQDVVAHLTASGWHGEMVQYNTHGTARFLLSRLIRDAGYKVVLGGEGADELFAGYDFLQTPSRENTNHFGLFQLFLPLARLLRPSTPAQRAIAETSPWLARLAKATNIPAHLQNGLAEQMKLLRSLLAPDFLKQFQTLDPYQELFHQIQGRKQLLGREYAKQMTYIWLKTFFANYHLGADRLDMAHSVETRLPFLDHKLFESVSPLPLSYLGSPGREKAFLREIAQPYLPEWIYNRPKKGFMAPPIEFQANGALYQFVQSVLQSEQVSNVPFLNPLAITQFVKTIPSLSSQTRAQLDPLLMLLTSFCLLQQRFRL